MQAFNPYLPSWEYIPDGEPHVFGDRVYVYGSHDRFNAPMFCMNDYVCWSAPVDDLSDWRYEGVIFRKSQDPKNKLGLRLLFAPDVCRGPDGRYYLYYAFDFMGLMGVAVCDTPAGQYQFHGWVKYPDGTLWGRRKGDQLPFDPGVLVDDDGRVYLYSGFYTPVPAVASGFKKLRNDGGVVLELEGDMVTIREEPKLLFPKSGPGAYVGHEFFEASSIRRYGDTYYFVYSSKNNHDLCYATAKSPTGPFTYGGVLVDIGDCGLEGRTEENARNYMGNTHGGMLHIGDKWYIFYHRQTNRHSYSRQACAEELRRNPDGSFAQAELTSCGLNGGPLKGEGKYEARIACNLWASGGRVGRYDVGNPAKALADHPYFTQSGKDREGDGDQYIANLRHGAVAGYKYFALKGLGSVAVEVRGSAGTVEVSTTPDFAALVAAIPVQASQNYVWYRSAARAEDGVRALYFRYMGDGAVDFKTFELNGEG